jgi:formylglycine-generating enzyme required for sulfatase activity
MRKFLAMLLALLFVSSLFSTMAYGQATVKDLEKLKKKGMPEKQILQQVKELGGFEMTAEVYVALRKKGFSDDFLDELENLHAKPQLPPKPSGLEGFTYLREATYTCGGQSHTVKEYRHNQTGMEFVLIPGGTFEMGSNDGESDEKPVHTVRVSGFLMSKYETTQAVWQKIMQSDPSNFKGANRPVEQVSWDLCQTFC